MSNYAEYYKDEISGGSVSLSEKGFNPLSFINVNYVEASGFRLVFQIKLKESIGGGYKKTRKNTPGCGRQA